MMITLRQKSLLEAIVNEYIITAEPVSSKLLAKSDFFGLSSATIRGEMSELENMGYLNHIHTSSGRVPTDKAYRYFVDNLIDWEHLLIKTRDKKAIQKTITNAGSDPRFLSRLVAEVLSDLSGNLVIASINLEREEDEFFKFGLSDLFSLPDFRGWEQTFRLASFFDKFEELFGIIERKSWGDADDRFDEIKIFIGRENSLKNIFDETVILTKYNLPGSCDGSLTLVGPTRMDYKRNISLIKQAKKELDKLAERT